MSVFSVPVTIGVNEDKIAKNIEQNVEQMVVDKITKEVEEIIFEKRYYSDRTEPLKRFVRDEIRKILDENKDVIIQEAANNLAERLVRTKAAKEATVKVIQSTPN